MLTASVWLFEVVLGVALTNGARIFFTGSAGGTWLKPWSVTGFEFFALFLIEIVLTALAGVFILYVTYGTGYVGRGVRPLMDVSILVVVGILFYALSLTLDHIETAPMPYFYYFGAIFLVMGVWSIIISIGVLRSGPRQAVRLLAEIVPAFLPVVIGVVLIWFAVPHLVGLLLMVVGLDALLAVLRTSGLLFPGTFRKHV
jgi:hypothetical protein